MKKFKLIVMALTLSLLLPMLPQTAEGHGSCTRRFYWYCFFPRDQWAVHSSISFMGTVVSSDYSGWQNFPYPYGAYAHAGPYAFQFTKYTPGPGCQRFGWVANHLWGRGDAQPDIVGALSDFDDGEYPQPPEDLLLEESTVSEKEVFFDPESLSVTVSGINATLRVKEGEPIVSQIRYEIWESEHEEDDEYSPDKVIYTTTLNLSGEGEHITADGPLADIPIEVYTDDAGFRVAQISDAALHISDFVIRNPCLIGIHMVSHAFANVESIIGESIAATEEKLLHSDFIFNTYPNPASDQLTILLQSPKNCTAEVYMYDNLGREVYKLKPEDLTPHAGKNIQVSLQPFAAGQYYIMVKTGEEKYLKTITITR